MMAAWNSHVVLHKCLHEALADENCTGGESAHYTGVKNEYDMILLATRYLLDILIADEFS
jgi:hypothetical protein